MEKTLPDLVLFYFPECPYCQTVLECMERLQLDIPLRNTRTEPDARTELIKIGGKGQVPCLLIDGQPMYESADIVNWLQANAK